MSSRKNLLVFLLLLIVVGLAALVWKQQRELTALRADAFPAAERADLQKRVWSAEKHVRELEHRLAAAPPAAGGAVHAEAAPAPRAVLGQRIAGMASLLNRPDAVRLMALQQKAQVDARYAALFKKLALPPAELAKLKGLLGDKLAAPIDVLAAAGEQGVDPVRNPQEFHQLVEDAQAQIDNQIKALLDPGSYAQYQNYVQTEPQRAVVNELQQSLSYTDTPLNGAQADQLVQILAQTVPAQSVTNFAYVGRSDGPNGPVVAVGTSAPGGMGFMFGSSPITDAAMTQAQAVLSPPQFQALQEIQQQQQAAAQLRQQMFQHAAAAGGPTPVSAPSAPAGGPGG